MKSYIVAISFTLYLIVQELLDFANSKHKVDAWKVWKLNLIEQDFQDCHPRWPLEKKWLEKEKEDVESVKPSYFHNYWNIFDWCVYILLIICVAFHVIDIFIVSDELCWPEDNINATSPAVETTGIGILGDERELESWAAKIHIRLFAITIIFVWLRLLKSARAFKSLGPFIVMCYNIIGDVARFCFLYFIVYIPYTCSFWMMFGGDVEEFETVSETLFSLFRMTLVDEYNYEGLKEENPVMCDILVGTYLAISAIVMLNLFIAMLSETFVR
ncbi:polycystin-2-like protein 2 [Ptychodera flava]|uniref:polycystin-2-like protein 2 n=1 Tax=Ptychodera flava TaxID=63121 RepID=UPI00396A7DE3